MIEIPALATAAVAALVPYLKSMADGAAKKSGEALGGKLADVGGGILAAMRKRLSTGDASADPLAAVESDPHDEDAQAALRFQLKGLLEKDEALRSELSRILKDENGHESAAKFQTTIRGDVEQLMQIAGSVGRIDLSRKG